MFPDIANVFCIREALWRHKALGNASIMVGAGFSRNADPLSTSARVMPNWSQMAEALCHPLYPLDDARRKAALRDANGTSGFLRLAQEYQAAFGASSLNDRIRSLVPDTDYRPGELHKRLLSLPWADVFTTNWDTLLERACADVFERSYDIVRTLGDIPFATRPRVVKLHGSFPAHEPFIFTEDEYRTYPVTFSPFVNLVQQSIMETIFCLVGFSGDDPNFLHWSGWVRDNLGAGAPMIYLVGWLELSAHRRRMLEARKVMPVDLSALPDAEKWPPGLRHRYATEWFIAALELGKPYGANHWPSPPSPPPPAPAYLGAIPASTQPLPRSEPDPKTSLPTAEREEALRTAIEVWAFNRRLYPGWLIAPKGVRETLRYRLGNWMTEFSLLPALVASDRLKALSELAWRMDRALLPFQLNQEEAAYAALASVERGSKTIGGTRLPAKEEWSEVLKGADTLALALARNARRSGDRSRFDQALLFLTPQCDHDPELRNAVAYEECLWDLAAGDLTSLVRRLDDWMPAHGEALWGLRKAGLLAEMQDNAHACALLEGTLAQIRRARRRDVDDLVSLSLEAWALFLALAYSGRGLSRRAPALSRDVPEPFERWRALAIVDCDALSDYRELKQLVETNELQHPEIVETMGFDLDHYGLTHQFGRGPSASVVAAYQMVMLAEFTGIPPAASHVKLFGDGLTAAAKILAPYEPWVASQLVTRIATGDKLLDDVFSRARIARLPERLITPLRDAVVKRVAFGLARIGTNGIRPDGLAMVESGLEILSRVAVRLPARDLRALLEGACSYYRSPVFRRMSMHLGIPLANLLARILESMPLVDLQDSLPLLFSLPLPGEVGVTTYEHRWRDPVVALPEWFDGAFDDPEVRSPAWESIVSRLLYAAKRDIAVDRAAAVQRLYYLQQWGVLSGPEIEAFAAALWMPPQRDKFGIPKDTNLPSWVLLIAPEDQPGQAREALLHFVAELSRERDDGLYGRLTTIGELLPQFVRLGISIDLSEDVKLALSALVKAWAMDRTQGLRPFDRLLNRSDQRESTAVEAAVAILPHIVVSDDILEAIWNKAREMDQSSYSGARAFAAYPVLARRWPEKSSELFDRLRRALLSDQKEEVQVAVSGLYACVTAQETLSGLGDAVLNDLVREVGIAIAARRQVLLRPALDFAQWVFREGPEHTRTLIAKTALMVSPHCWKKRAMLDLGRILMFQGCAPPASASPRQW
jgi:SIR2-like domain